MVMDVCVCVCVCVSYRIISWWGGGGGVDSDPIQMDH